MSTEQGPAKRTESEKLNIKQTSKWHSAAVEKRMSASWVLFTLLFPQAKTQGCSDRQTAFSVRSGQGDCRILPLKNIYKDSIEKSAES